MLWIAAAAALAGTSAPPVEKGAWRPMAGVQATASIRIISGVMLKLDAAANAGAPSAHDGKVRTEDGLVRPARLIEFE